MLLNLLREDAFERSNQFLCGEDKDQETFNAILAKCDEHFKGKKIQWLSYIKVFPLFGETKDLHIIADDMRIVGDTEQDHDEALLTLLQWAQDNNIKSDASKLQFKRNKVVYCGMKLTAEYIQADSSKAEAILKYQIQRIKQASSVVLEW